jgi:hypothetical protein
MTGSASPARWPVCRRQEAAQHCLRYASPDRISGGRPLFCTVRYRGLRNHVKMIIGQPRAAKPQARIEREWGNGSGPQTPRPGYQCSVIYAV